MREPARRRNPAIGRDYGSRLWYRFLRMPDATDTPPLPPDRARAQRAWCWYDWANSAFSTTVVAAILPPWFASIAGRSMPPHQATAMWGYASAAALLVTALLSPLVGAAADLTGRRKPMLAACVVLGASGTAALAMLPSGQWVAVLAAFGVAFLAFAIGNVLYDSLLMSVATPDEAHAVSSRGFAWGYLGGGLLLAAQLALILMPRRFGLADAGAATRVAFLSTAAWWLVFSMPILRHVVEPPPRPAAGDRRPLTARVFGQLAGTFAHLRAHPDLLTFLIAFWLYSDGIGTIVKMATIYGSEVGIGRNDLIGALLMVQLVAAPASLAFGRLAQPLGPKRAVLFGLAGYVAISVFAYFLQRPWQFWVIALMVALFQGGTQALSRSMFSSLVPARRSGEFFGFYSVSEKLAGVVGPLLFGVVAQLTGGGRLATLTLLPLFIGGAWLLTRVDLGRGRALAEAARDG